MIARFDPARREFTPEGWPTRPPGASPWTLVQGQPVRVWFPGPWPPEADPWMLGRIPFAGGAWLEIPDGAGVAGSIRIMGGLVRVPAACDVETVRALAAPPKMATGHATAEWLAREVARRQARTVDCWHRAQRLPITPPAPAWGLS